MAAGPVTFILVAGVFGIGRHLVHGVRIIKVVPHAPNVQPLDTDKHGGSIKTLKLCARVREWRESYFFHEYS